MCSLAIRLHTINATGSVSLRLTYDCPLSMLSVLAELCVETFFFILLVITVLLTYHSTTVQPRPKNANRKSYLAVKPAACCSDDRK